MSKYKIPLTGPRSITKINDQIRSAIKKAKTRDALSKLVSESRYLYTLTYSPSVKKSIRGMTESTRRRAKNEFTKTARLANRILQRRNIKGAKYDTKI